MILGLNVDPTRNDHTPTEIAALGAKAVRVVIRDGLQDWCRGYRAAGLKVLGVVARESFHPGETYSQGAERMARDFAGLVDEWQRGNEPDLTSPSSFSMAPLEYLSFCWDLDILQPAIHAGLASGNAEYVLRVFLLGGPRGGTPDLPWAIHPYDTGGLSIHAWLQRYRDVGAYRFRLTEMWPDENQTRAAFHEGYDIEEMYWWWHDPHNSDGWLSIRDNPYDIDVFKRLAAEINGGSMPTTPAPEFIPGHGFANYAAANPEVGKALSSERYFVDDISVQVCEGGLLVYAKESDKTIFLPGKA